MANMINKLKGWYKKNIPKLCECDEKAIVQSWEDRKNYCFNCLDKKEKGKADITHLKNQYHITAYG